MFVHKSQYLKFGALQAWYPAAAADVVPLLGQSPVVMLWQCPEKLRPEFERWSFFARAFRTPLIDLSQSEAELLQKLDAKSCRYEIRKAQKLDCVITLNESSDDARKLINESIRRLQYRSELGQAQWQDLRADHDIFVCRWQGIPVVAHVILRDFPGRARLMNSGSEDRTQERFRSVVGPANRLLHWHEFLHYQKAGYRHYDFGGYDDSDKESPEYAISQFKMSFGAEVVSEPMLYLARNPLLRLFLGSLAKTRGGLRKVPWPKTWLHALKTNPRLGSLFR